MADDGRFDDLFLALARKHKSTEELTNSILSFFERRTDLFHIMETPTDRMGFMPRVAERMFFKHFRFFQHKYWARAQPHLLRRLAAGAQGEAGSGEAPAGVARGNPALHVEAVQAAVSGSGSSSASTSVPAPLAQQQPAQPTQDGNEAALPEQTRRKMRHISTWNGAVTDKYCWSQSIRDVTLEVEVEPCRAKDVQVDVKPTRLCIKCKGKTVLEGKLHEKVSTEDSVWHLDNGNQVVVSMEKHRETWWKCVLEGDEEIDTTKVESTRSMDEYDGETQGAIRKIMFDQNQKVLGKPTSDQIRTAEIMKEAWNAPGSPFRGSEFDPTLLNLSGPVSEDFFQEIDQKRLEEARRQKGQSGADA